MHTPVTFMILLVILQNSLLDSSTYKVLHDITLRKKDGTTSQIDHIVVSPFGIFVIETKNYRGWILGKESSQQWTQSIYKHKENLYNPIWQNRGHVKALCDVLGNAESKYIPIVAFTTRAELKIEVKSEVIYIRDLLITIQKYRVPILTLVEVNEIVAKLGTLRIMDKKVIKKHVEVIQQKKAAVAQQIRQGECPRCGGRLVERSGEYGKFMGCSKYQRCRYILKG